MNGLLTINHSRWFGVPEGLGLNMKLIQLLTVSLASAVLGAGAAPAFAADQEGVAIAIVYDTSGSMNEPVKDETGKSSPKYLIANRALVAIANRLQSFATNGAAGSPRKIHAGLFVFQKDGPHAAIYRAIGVQVRDQLKGAIAAA